MYMLKGQHTLEDMLWGHKVGTCCSNSFLHVTCQFLRKRYGAAIKLCPCNMLHDIQLVWICESWSRDKMVSIFDIALSALPLQTVPATTHFYASIHFVFTILHTSLDTCILCMHTKRYVPASHPTTFTLVCANLNKLDFFCALSFFENPKNSQAKQGHKEGHENSYWIKKSIQ